MWEMGKLLFVVVKIHFWTFMLMTGAIKDMIKWKINGCNSRGYGHMWWPTLRVSMSWDIWKSYFIEVYWSTTQKTGFLQNDQKGKLP